MAPLITLLRRILLMLLLAMSMIIVVVYWNQGSLKPIGFVSALFDRSGQQNNPAEKSWTYKCRNNKCVRDHFIADDGSIVDHDGKRRVPFMTCAMSCGEALVWPLPTGKITLSSQSLTFSTDVIQIRVEADHLRVKKLFDDASTIFLNDLKILERDNYKKINGRDTLDLTKERNIDEGGNSVTQKENLYVVHTNCDIKNLAVNVIIGSVPDLFIHMNTDETYELNIETLEGNTNVEIKANSFFGARHGLATLQQLIWYDDEYRLLKILSEAHIKDGPKFRYRGLMLDTSRHYFSIDAIKRTLVGMAHSKLNRFHWHITDSQSFPFVSKYYPELAKYGAYSSKELYTHKDIKEIVDFARVRGIQIIPEIDAPAHAGNGWDWGPKHGLGELSLCINQQPWNYYCGEPPCGQLNPKNNNTYLVLQKLYTELLELTGPTDYFHLGGDEVNLECWGQFFNDTDMKGLWCDFMLQAYQRLKIANNNISPRMTAVWSSGLTSTPCLSRQNFVVQVWGGSTWQENYELLMNGYSILISHVDAWYLDCGFGSWRSTGEGACAPYTTWQRVYKHRPWERMHIEPVKMKQILGGEACLWAEQVDENTLDSRLWPRSAALAERLWTDPEDDRDLETVRKETFNRMSVFRNRLVDWGLKAEPIFPKYCAQNQEECV